MTLTAIEHECQVEDEILTMLDELIADIRSGQVTGFAIAVQERGGEATILRGGHQDPALLGALEWLKHDIATHLTEESQ
ncbi:MAG: hypothetical protein AB7F35_20250 [Acetobacteraceae bacterium]